MEDIHRYIGGVSYFVIIINIILLSYFFHGKRSINIIIIFLILSFFVQIFATILSEYKQNNLFLLHIYTLLEFILLSLFYRQEFPISPEAKKKYLWGIGAVSLLVVANSIFLEPLSTFNNNAKTLTQTLIIGQAIAYLFFNTEQTRHRLTSTFNLFNAAVLLYYAGSFFIFMFSDFLAKNSVNMHRIFLAVNALLYLVFQLLVLIGLWKYLQQRTKSI